MKTTEQLLQDWRDLAEKMDEVLPEDTQLEVCAEMDILEKELEARGIDVLEDT